MPSDGYLIVRCTEDFVARYENRAATEGFARELAALRKTLGFVNVRQYRGMGRDPLGPLPDHLVAEFLRKRRDDSDTNLAARLRFFELRGDNGPLVSDLRVAQQLVALVENPMAWEVITVSKDLSGRTPRTLGFDLGWWGDDFYSDEFYSLISDCIVAPRWHGPDPASFAELAEQLRGLNRHVLFETPLAAQQFRKFYVEHEWAEHEDGEPFIPVRIDKVPEPLAHAIDLNKPGAP
jgi:hypothetical protein